MRFLIGAVASAMLLPALPQKVQSSTPTPPTLTFQVHAHKTPTVNVKAFWTLRMEASAPLPMIVTTADRQGLLVLIPQEGRKWELQWLTGWATGTPQMKSLDFEGDESLDPQDYIRAGLTPSPDGKYLLVRIFVLNFRHWNRSAVALLVDLTDFRVVWRKVTDDPLVANSRWRFIDSRNLVAMEGPSPASANDGEHHWVELFIPPDVLTMNPNSPGKHEVAMLSLPGLRESRTCNYSAQAVPVSEVNADMTARSVTHARFELHDSDCVDLLKAAGVSSLGQLLGNVEGLTTQFKGTTCDLDDLNRRRGLALYNCRRGHMTERRGFITEAEDEEVLAFPDRHILSVALKPNETYSGTLATADGHSYFVFLRKKLRAEIYELP